MYRVNRCVALTFVITASVGISNAANHTASFGTFSTAVNESRLFIKKNNATSLRCDLFFSAAGSDRTLVASKGSVVSQSVPAFVWQYSGLLPVSDYLKTVAIHSASSDQKIESWQDVQLDFYNGLRVEGVRESDAKIAYAGAYAFAPRWPLVEFIDITVPERDKETRLYKVSYTSVDEKGVSIEDYQALALDILAAPEKVSLQDIRGVVDAADASTAAPEKTGTPVSDLFAGNNNATPEELPKVIEAPAMKSEKQKVGLGDESLDMLFSDEMVEPAAPESGELLMSDATESINADLPEPAGVEVAIDDLVQEVTPLLKPEVTGKEILGAEDTMDVDTAEEEGAPPVSMDPAIGSQPNVWKKLPDGSVVLEQIEG